jgi:Spy/CpxP family protein refolding chaperone
MKRYTLPALIHDAKIFNRLRLEYRQTKKNRRKDSSSGWSPTELFGDLDRRAEGVLVRTMKRNFLTLAAAALIVLGGSAVVQAQNPRGGGGRGRGVERLTEGLNLTPDQQAKIQPIIAQAQPQIAEIHREAMQKMKAVMASTASQIRPLLTPEQQQKFDNNQKARQGRRNAHKERDDTMED